MTTLAHFVERSSNAKTGPIPVVYVSRESCPDSCLQKQTGACYAQSGPVALQWRRADTGLPVTAIAQRIKALPDGTLYRWGVAGDTPGMNEEVDVVELHRLARASRGKKPIVYSHKHGPQAIDAYRAVLEDFPVNLSADSPAHADTLVGHGLPVVCIVPSDSPDAFSTPAGHPVRICPAQLHDDITCSTCRVCSMPDRKHIVGFRPHGTRKRLADKTARIGVTNI